MGQVIKTKNAIFLDLDETLVHSVYRTSVDRNPDRFKDWIGNLEHKSICEGKYITFLRPETRNLIAYCQELAPTYILSWGGVRYVTEIIMAFNLNIPADNIYGAEDITFSCLNPPFYNQKFRETNNILVDNEFWDYHAVGDRNKIKFLSSLPETHLVEIPDIYVDLWNPLEKDDLSEVYDKINSLLV